MAEQEEPTGRRPAESEPDYRFTLANERTFLAWIRTALGLLAGGVAVHELVPSPSAPGVRSTLVALCVGLALVLTTVSYPRWRAAQRAMRRGDPLPSGRPLLLLTGGVLLVVVCAAMLVIIG